jgi:PKD repeat protein
MSPKGSLVFALILTAVSTHCFSQCDPLSFSTNSTLICKGQAVQISNTSSDALEYHWDFCDGDLANTPTAQTVKQVLAAAGLTGVDMVEDQGQFYLFLTGRTSNNLVRLDFGTDPENSNPAITNLGNINNAFSGPVNIKVVREQNNWYGLVYNSATDQLLRISFGGSVSNNSPTVESVIKAYGSNNTNAAIEIGVSQDKTVVIVTNPATNKLTLINFGNSITNTPTDPADIIMTGALSGSTSLRGITLIRDCAKWYGFAVAATSKKLYRLEFGDNLFSVPIVQDITGVYSGLENFQDIRIQYDGGIYTGFVLTTQGIIYRLDFSGIGELPVKTNLTNLGVISNTFFFDFIKHNSRWYFYSGNFGTRNVYRGSFPDECSANVKSVSGHNPPAISFSAAGTYKITLTGKGATGLVSHRTESVTVQSQPAPAISLITEGMCEKSEVQFSIANNSDVVSTSWTFGDGDESLFLNPVHQYNLPGVYPLKLVVLGINGCNNFVEGEIKIYSRPVADFTLPSNVTCTGNEITILNSTIDTYDGNVSYKWVLDNQVVATGRDFIHQFNATGDYAITLISSIPGCSDEATRILTDVRSGPDADFLYEGNCDNANVRFSNITSGDVSTYKWYIDNTFISETNEISKTINSGPHQVMLEAYGNNSCVSSVVKDILVNAAPVAGFSIASPVTYCEETPLQFNDASTSANTLDKWDWKIDGISSSVRNPIYNFADAALEEVTLKVTDVNGCADSIKQTLNILPKPNADFTHTSLCIGTPVTFTSAGSSLAKWNWEIADKKYTNANAVHTFRTPGQYQVSFTPTGANGCSRTESTEVYVYPEVNPDFSVVRNCVDQNTLLSDNSQSEDELVYWKWKVLNKVTEGDHAEATFAETGIYPVEFSVRTASGCAYSINENIEIVEAPLAVFRPSSEIGAPESPFEFYNHSTNADAFYWNFGDGNESTDASPEYMFPNVGNYSVSLTAKNDKGCESTASKTIRISPAQPDIEILSVSAIENPDKSIELALMISNNGNTVFENLKVAVDVSGTLVLTETIPDRIFPQARYNLTLNYGIQKKESLKFICAEAMVKDDVQRSDNKNCISIESEKPQVLPVYPNPAKDVVSIEWMGGSESMTTISIINSMGGKIYDQQFETLKGLNRKTIELPVTEQGIYMIVIQSGSFSNTQRVVLTH